ncbi:MAG: hypothetical protein QOK42_2605 [Frankiaceae bacterium]|jgi:hypothetical protein|nr:hypothetical protein [Frankiaceae bacterium]MDX6225988.1 hypothetical protein [Frankiales bacterium]MDX6275509.1 hypothetical protein [Frankiales bacterium]
MKIRAALATAALLATGVATYADAAAKPKPVCKNLTDDKGDVVFAQASNATAYEDEALDIVSADLGSNAKTITAAIRVAKLAVPAATSAATTYELRFSLPAGDPVFVLWANVPASGAAATYGVGTVGDPTGQATVDLATSTGTATGTIDLAKSEIRISAPLSAIAGAKNGQKVGLDQAVAKRTVPGQYYGRFADDGAGGKRYVLGTLSCVKPGA